MHEVKETLNESYCDVSGQAENLKLAGKILDYHPVDFSILTHFS
jgi:hypothetical protein